ncbi:MAG: hypothetical protein IJS61_01575 [Firmicutes bacterium]|nr:hypothetical protein [Bacillota bacterium]
MAANREHKDRLFKFIFGNRKNLEWTLSLYNAVNGTRYTNPADIRITTVEDAVYMSMKNDVSFLIGDTMSFYEQQSTYNPNMPMRFLIYMGMVYSKYIENSEEYNLYSSNLQKAPTPKCVCFYNGTTEKEDRKEILLSEAFDNKGDVEVKVLMININYGHNMDLLEACKPLNEYSWFVSRIREYQKNMNSLEDAVDAAIEEMGEDFVIKPFIIDNKAEVKRMCITEYDEEKTYAAQRREGRAEGKAEGKRENALTMIKDGLDVKKISLYSGLPLEEILELVKQVKSVPV